MSHLDERIEAVERYLQELRDDEHRLNYEIYSIRVKRRGAKISLTKLKARRDAENGKADCPAVKRETDLGSRDERVSDQGTACDG